MPSESWGPSHLVGAQRILAWRPHNAHCLERGFDRPTSEAEADLRLLDRAGDPAVSSQEPLGGHQCCRGLGLGHELSSRPEGCGQWLGAVARWFPEASTFIGGPAL